MKKVNSLILLIKTLSKAEKKAVYLDAKKTGQEKVYLNLFNLISLKGIEDASILQKEYCKKHSKISFQAEVRYLYSFILGTLTKIKINQDKSFGLYRVLLNAIILRDRNLNEDYYSMLKYLSHEAERIGDYQTLFQAERMELDFLKSDDFKNIEENDLLKKHYRLGETLTIIKQINEQSALYELLLFRIEKDVKGKVGTLEPKYKDLVISEMLLVHQLKKEVFEIQKKHQLFQALYLSNTGDYKAALNAYINLDNLFQKNRDLWHNPPIYYMNVLEGILKSLRDNKMYDQMAYFFDRLISLKHSSIPFQTEVNCIVFIYKIDVLLRKKEYVLCLVEIDNYRESLLKRKNILSPYRYIQLSLQLAIIYLLNGKYITAQKQLVPIINNENYSAFSLFRGVRLINLILYYERDEIDIVTSQIRSIKRKYKIMKFEPILENILFHFINMDLVSLNQIQKNRLRKQIKTEFAVLRTGRQEELLSIFDFERWILYHLTA